MYSATDLLGFLECRHLANLERAAVEAHLARPVRADPVLDRIAQRRREHLREAVVHLTGGRLAFGLDREYADFV